MRVFAIFLSVLFILSSGCADSSGDNKDKSSPPQRYSYIVETVPFPTLPEGMEHIDCIFISGETIYFAGFTATNEPFNSSKLYSVSIDGTDFKELPNYVTGAHPPPGAKIGIEFIKYLYSDNDGNLYVVEDSSFSAIGEDFTIYVLENFCNLRKLNSYGANIKSFDISRATNQPVSDMFFNLVTVTGLITDIAGNIYISISPNSNLIYVFDSNGNFLFTLDCDETFEQKQFVLTSNGTVAVRRWRDTTSVLQSINIDLKTWGETVGLPSNVKAVYSGNEDFYTLFTDDLSLYGICNQTGEKFLILNWIETGIIPDSIEQLSVLEDGRIVLLVSDNNRYSDMTGGDIVILNPVPYNSASQNPDINSKTELTLGTIMLSSQTQAAVVQFNTTSTTHFIRVIDYSRSTSPDDKTAAILNLTTEITAGRAPDILDLNGLPYDEYISKGLFIDLYELFDTNDTFNRDHLFESVLKAIETDGKLYRIVTDFSVSTLMGNPLVLGSYPGWNIDEMKAILDENPQADMPLGPFFDKIFFLSLIFYHNMDEYIDTVSGAAHFDNDDFIGLLEFANTFPSEVDWDNVDYQFQQEVLATGRQIMAGPGFGDFYTLRSYITDFGGEIVFKGWPTGDRNGNRFRASGGFAVTTNTTDINGSRDFICYILSEDYQQDYIKYNLPLSKAVFTELLTEAMTVPISVQDDVISQENATKIMALINSITRTTGHGEGDIIWNLVSESASDYFNGLTSAGDAARVIQNRVSIYLSEQTG